MDKLKQNRSATNNFIGVKILETITDLNLSSGGAVTSTLNSYGFLRERGIDIDMVTLRPYSDDDAYLGGGYDGINALPFDGKTQFVYSKNLKKFLESNRGYDIYHANGIWTYPTYKTIRVARKEDKPCIVTIHGMLNRDALKMTSFKKQIFLKLFQKQDLQSVAYIHATSEYEAECIRELGITTPIAVIPNGVIDCKLKHSFSIDGIVRFGFVGRTDPVKNIDILLSTWQKLGNYTKNCQLAIIGGGNDSEYSKKLHTFVSEHNMNNVVFTGLLSKEKALREMAKLDYLILPSRSENFGMVIPEALSMGIPCIASKGTPWNELNTHNCGWWIDGNEDSLCDAIKNALNTPTEEYNLMATNGVDLVMSKYSIDKTVDKLINLYKALI